MYEVYLIENTVNDKLYVGVTSIGLHDRWICHKSCARNGTEYPLYADMRQFGVDKFSIKLIDSTDTKELGESLEISYIKKFNSMYPNGYNLTGGGFGPKDSIWITDAERYHDRGKKISQALSGKSKSVEHRKHISESRLGKFTGTDNPFYGKHHSDDTKQHISDNNSKIPVVMIDVKINEALMQFKNPYDAARYVIDCGLTSSSEPKTCATRIMVVAKSENVNSTAYGFHWGLVKV